MTVSYEALRDLVNGAAYAGLSDAEAADAVNAATVSRVRVFRWGDARSEAIRHGRWGYVLARARLTPVVPVATAADAAIMAAIQAANMEATQEIAPSDDDAWAALCQGLAALQASGDITQACSDAIMALGAEDVSPATMIGWPAVTVHDVAHARSLGNG